MERTKFASLLLVSVLATMTLAGVITYSSSTKPEQSVEEVLNIPSTPLQQRLYPAGGAIDTSVELRVPHMRYINYTDKSTEDVVLMPNSSTDMISSQWYYAEQPGESGRRPYISRVYGAGNVVISEKVQQLNGLLSRTTVVDPVSTARTITDFAADGVTLLREQVYLKPACCSDEDLLREERWRDDADHSLAYRNIYHADETRTITWFDASMKVLKVMDWPKWESINGAKMKVYYPGTLNLRLDSSADYYTNTVKYYRPDGTLEAIVGISSSTTLVQYFDATGTKERLEQLFYRDDVKKDGLVESTYRLYQATEFDAQGSKAREQTFHDGKPDAEEVYNVTINGVKYVEVDYDYDKDGTLKQTRYWRYEVKFPPYRTEEHKPAEARFITPMNADSQRLQIQIDKDLPIPPPQRGGH